MFFFICRLKHLLRAALMWVKDAVPRLSSWVSPSRWPESKITIFLWPRSRHCMVACSCQSAIKTLVSHSTRVWLKCSWIIINIRCLIPEEHGGNTVENEGHAGVRPHCGKLVESQKARAVPTLHGAVQRAWASENFSRGVTRWFFQFSRGGQKVVEFVFPHSKPRKQPFC